MHQNSQALKKRYIIAFITIIACTCAIFFSQNANANSGYGDAEMNERYIIPNGNAGEEVLKLEFANPDAVCPKLIAKWNKNAKYEIWYQYKINEEEWSVKDKQIDTVEADENYYADGTWSSNPGNNTKIRITIKLKADWEGGNDNVWFMLTENEIKGEISPGDEQPMKAFLAHQEENRIFVPTDNSMHFYYSLIPEGNDEIIGQVNGNNGEHKSGSGVGSENGSGNMLFSFKPTVGVNYSLWVQLMQERSENIKICLDNTQTLKSKVETAESQIGAAKQAATDASNALNNANALIEVYAPSSQQAAAIDDARRKAQIAVNSISEAKEITDAIKSRMNILKAMAENNYDAIDILDPFNTRANKAAKSVNNAMATASNALSAANKLDVRAVTVNYKDGNNILHSYNALFAGDNTPVYNPITGPKKQNYVFHEWAPGWQSKITAADVTIRTTGSGKKKKYFYEINYSAKWEKDINNNGTADDKEEITVTYKDGEKTLKTEVPKKPGATLEEYTPANKTNYVFDKWNPEWKSVVALADTDKNSQIIYNATWKDDKNNNGVADEKDNFKIIYKDGDDVLKSFPETAGSPRYVNSAKTPAYTPENKKKQVFDTWFPKWQENIIAKDANKNNEIIYNAVWKDDKNENSVPDDKELFTIIYMDGDKSLKTVQSQKAGATLKKYTPVKSGFAFTGWSPTWNSIIDAADANKAGEIIFKANWKKFKTKPNSNLKDDNDVLLLQTISSGEKRLTATWTKVKSADGYDIFMAKCSANSKNKMEKVKTIKGNMNVKWESKKLKKHTAYKMVVKAFVKKNGKKKYIKESLSAHCYTTGGNKKYTNPKNVKINKSKVTLQTGRTATILATVTKLKKNRKLPDSDHGSTLRYISSNKNIAIVNNKGEITAKAKGCCNVYVFAINGIKATIKTTTKGRS